MYVALAIACLLAILSAIANVAIWRNREEWIKLTNDQGAIITQFRAQLARTLGEARDRQQQYERERDEHARFVDKVIDRGLLPPRHPAVDDGPVADPPSVRSADRAAAEEQRARPLAHGRSAVGVSDPTVPPVHRAEEEEGA